MATHNVSRKETGNAILNNIGGILIVIIMFYILEPLGNAIIGPEIDASGNIRLRPTCGDGNNGRHGNHVLLGCYTSPMGQKYDDEHGSGFIPSDYYSR